jgi:outer membrane immunogenic protein
MRSLMLALAASVSFASLATAADIPVRSAPPAVPAIIPFSWTGPYVGVNAGWSWGRAAGGLTVPATVNGAANAINAQATSLALMAGNQSHDVSGFTGGLTLGYNYQMNNIVLGVEGDVNYLGLGKTYSGPVQTIARSSQAIDKIDGSLLATLRLRAGYAMGRSLIYLTGGVAFTDAKFKRNLDWTFSDTCPASALGVRCHTGSGSYNAGWTLGAGYEHAFSNNLTGKIEYLYTDFGSAKFTSTNAGIAGQQLQHSAKLNLHTVRLGVNYKF